MLPLTATTLGFYNYDPKLFELLELPEGVDKYYCIDNILLETSELEVMYPTWQHLHDYIGLWSRLNQDNWKKLWDVLNKEYNPIWNKDGTITETESTTGNEKSTGSKSGTTTQATTDSETTADDNTRTLKRATADDTTDSLTGSDNETKDMITTVSGSDSDTSTHNVAGFNDDTLRASTSDSSNGTNSSTTTDKGTDNVAHTSTRTIGNTGSIDDTETTKGKGTKEGTQNVNGTSEESTTGNTDTTGTRKYERVEQGNIGVTTTQAMITEEIELRLQNNFYHYILDSYKDKFCLGIY